MAFPITSGAEIVRIVELLIKTLGTGDLSEYYLVIDKQGDDRSYRVSLANLLLFSGNQFYDNLFKLISNADDNNELTFSLDNYTDSRTVTWPDKDITVAGLQDLIAENLSTVEINTSLVLAPDGAGGVEFRAESGGGGGIATQLNQGTAYTFVGELLNDSFPGTTLNATYWTGSLPTGASINDKLIITSGSAAWDRYIQMKTHYLYEKLDIEITVKCVTKNIGDGWGFKQDLTLLLYYNSGITIQFDQYTGILTFANIVMPAIDFVANDTLKFTFKRRPSKTIITIENLTDTGVLKVIGEVDEVKWGTEGFYRLSFLGGQQEFTNITISSTELNYGGTTGLVVLGDSIAYARGHVADVSKRFSNILMRGLDHLMTNISVNSWLAGTFSASVVSSALTPLNGKYLLINVGYNDFAQTTNLATFTANLETIATTAQGLGYTVVFSSPFFNSTSYNDAIATAATNTGCKFIDIMSTWLDGSVVNEQYLYDAIHPNEYGHAFIASKIGLYFNELSEILLQDYENEDILLRNIGYSNEDLPILGINEKSKIVRLNSLNYRNLKTVRLQKNLYSDDVGNVGFTGKLRIGNTFQQNCPTGINYGSSTGDNIQIGKWGGNGLTTPQLFDGVTGYGNVVLYTTNVIYPGKPQISGNNNLLFGTLPGSTLSGSNNVLIRSQAITSGGYNIGIGTLALKSITTGSENIHICTYGAGNGAFSAAISNTIFIGDPTRVNNNALVNGDIVICVPYGQSNPSFWFGGKSDNATSDTYFNIPFNNGTNKTGHEWYIRAGIGSGNGEPGKVIFQHSTPVESGSAKHSAFTNTLTLERTRITSIVPIISTQYKLSSLNTAPANASDTGELGEIKIDDSFIYVCIAANTWKRAVLTTW